MAVGANSPDRLATGRVRKMNAVRPVNTFDYLRLCGHQRRTVTLRIPDEVVPCKGRSSKARARARRTEQELRRFTQEAFQRKRRRPFRGDVAVHIGLSGGNVTRTVKAICDGLEGPVYGDDRAISLLDVDFCGADGASVSVCAAREYTDAFDILHGASTEDDSFDREIDSWSPPPFESNWDWHLDDDLETAEEHLDDSRNHVGLYPKDLAESLVEHNEWMVSRLRRQKLLSCPYEPHDRPGALSLAGRIWAERPPLSRPARVFVPAPDGGEGSWSAKARTSVRHHFEQWDLVSSGIYDEPVSLDIAIGMAPRNRFDVDNLASRVLKAFRAEAPSLRVSSLRAFRTAAFADLVIVRLHPERRAGALRSLLGAYPMGVFEVRPEEDAPAHRRKATDERVWAELKKTSLAMQT